MKNKFLKKTIERYLIAGVLASVIFLAYLLLVDYKKSLEDSVSRFSNITIKAVKMKNAIQNMHQAVDALNAIYPHITSLTSKDALLTAADDIKRIVKGGEILIQDIKKEGGEMILPLEIKIDGARYSDIVNTIGYLQAHRLPYATIEKMAVSKQMDGTPAQSMSCAMEIFLRMPDDGKEQ